MNKLSFDIGSPFFGQEPSQSTLGNPQGVGKIVSAFLADAIIAAGIILIFLLVFGGISIIAGAGESNPQKVGQGKQAATAALLGFIIIFSAYWILQIIKGVTGIDVLPVFGPT